MILQAIREVLKMLETVGQNTFLAWDNAFNASLRGISIRRSQFEKIFYQLDARNRAGAMGTC